MQAFVEGIRGIIQANPATRKDYYEVHMSGFGASSLDVMVYFFFELNTWSEELQQRHWVLLEILRLAQRLGIAFAFPTQTVHVDTLAASGAERMLPAPMASEQLEAIGHAFAPGGAAARPGGVPVTHGYYARTAAAKPASAAGPVSARVAPPHTRHT